MWHILLLQTAQPVDKTLSGDSTLLKICLGLQARAPLCSESKTTQRSKDRELFVLSLSEFMVSLEESGKNFAEQGLCPRGSADLYQLPLYARMHAISLGASPSLNTSRPG